MTRRVKRKRLRLGGFGVDWKYTRGDPSREEVVLRFGKHTFRTESLDYTLPNLLRRLWRKKKK